MYIYYFKHQFQEGFRPAKYFSIDKVFRNETLDATHLAEFQQIEGVVAEPNLNMKNLMAVIKVQCLHYF